MPQNLIWLRHKVQVSAMLIVIAIALLLTLAGSPCPLSWRNFFLRRSFFWAMISSEDHAELQLPGDPCKLQTSRQTLAASQNKPFQILPGFNLHCPRYDNVKHSNISSKISATEVLNASPLLQVKLKFHITLPSFLAFKKPAQ